MNQNKKGTKMKKVLSIMNMLSNSLCEEINLRSFDYAQNNDTSINVSSDIFRRFC